MNGDMNPWPTSQLSLVTYSSTFSTVPALRLAADPNASDQLSDSEWLSPLLSRMPASLRISSPSRRTLALRMSLPKLTCVLSHVTSTLTPGDGRYKINVSL